MIIQPGSKLVMAGDSVTDVERSRPYGEGLFQAVGKGYPAIVDALLGSFCPERHIRLVNMGSSGDTSRDLKARWQTDVLDLKPDWVSVMIGVNDVWRQYDTPLQEEWHVLQDEYEANLESMITQTIPAVQGMVLMTPYYIEPNRQDPMRATIDAYSQVVRRLAEKHGTVFVDTQAAFDRVLQNYYPATLSWDRVHPNHIGTMVIAKAFLDALGFVW